MTGSLAAGVTATDLALTVTQLLRKAKVVGKFVEFFGAGAAALQVVDRATIANMAPEYGATMGFFPIDEHTCQYLIATGRFADQVATFRNYFKAQGLFGMPTAGQCDYSELVELNLSEVQPSIAGPRRPQDRIPLNEVRERFTELFQKPIAQNGYNKPLAELGRRFATEVAGQMPLTHTVTGGGQQASETAPTAVAGAAHASDKNTSATTELEMMNNRPTPDLVQRAAEFKPAQCLDLGHGDVLIAAITSCTNTSNPSVMLGAGLLAKKALEKGLSIRPTVKTSLAPGSRVVTEYLRNTGLQRHLDELGFQVVGYGCTTCIGNSGPLDPGIEDIVVSKDLVGASVLSGNRNFEARIHQSIKANFLMSPPLVVAFALAGNINIDLSSEPIGQGKDGRDVFLRDIWPTTEEIGALMRTAFSPDTFRQMYSDFAAGNPLWNDIPSSKGHLYQWDPNSTYIQEPPFFAEFSLKTLPISEIKRARPLAIFGDSVTTDHISPAGAIKPTSPSGLYLQHQGVPIEDFNSYGARRGNDRVMTRGTFANVRINNLMVAGVEGGITIHYPTAERTSIYEAAVKYQAEHVPLVVIAGQEYGTGSSRDWAAKGTSLLGVKAVIAQSFERIHRSNLVGMGVIPLQFKEGTNAQTLSLNGSELFDVVGLGPGLKPQQDLTLRITRSDGSVEDVPVICRIDTPIEIDYYQHGGILPFVLRQLVSQA
jgi:aconitate hydratase